MTDKASPEPPPITIVLIDDNPGFQTALAAHLANQAHLVLLGVAGSAREALQLPATLDPDIVLLDMHLPDRLGLHLIQPLQQQWPRTKIIVLTFDDYPRLRQRVLAAGATDFVSKLNAADQLVPAIHRALHLLNGDTPPWQAETGTSSGY